MKRGSWTVGSSLILNWEAAQEAVVPSYSGRATVNVLTGALTLSSVTVADSGVYVVQSTDPQLQATTSISVHEPISNVTLKANQTDFIEFNASAVALCSVSSGSSLFFLWMNGSSEVTASDRVQLTDGNSSLTVVNVSRYDPGPFRCRVSNPVSNGTSDPVKFTIIYGPDNMALTVNGSFLVGSNLTMLCSAQSNPPAQLQWAFRGAFLNTTGPLLELYGITEDHSGPYSCVAFNNQTNMNSSISSNIAITKSGSNQQAVNVWLLLLLLWAGFLFSVQGKLANICRSESDCDHTISPDLNSSQTLSRPEAKLRRMESSVVFLLILVTITFSTDCGSCQTIVASENPLPVGSNVTLSSQTNVTQGVWLLNNSMILMIFGGDPFINVLWRNRVTFNATNSSLSIRSVQLADSGVYTLQELNVFRAELTLSVQVPISNVTLMAKATNLVEFNDTAVLMCSVSHGTSLSYVWLMNNTVFSGGNVQLSNGNATLTIVGVTRHDDGAFACMAINGISNATSPPVFLNISYGPSNTSMMITPMKSDHIYRTGSNLTLSCSTLSSPTATVEWMVNGVALNKSGRWIHLHNAAESNSGNYKCVFHNPVTSRFSSASTMIQILDPLEAVTVNRIGGPAILNKSFTLHCEVTGTVNRIQWWRNWQLIVPDNTTIIDMNNKTLTLNPIQHSDNGDYKCQAFNAVSNMTSSPYRVEVNYGPEMPTIMGPSLVKAGYNITLTCNASSNPPAYYRWYFNESLVADTAEYVTPRLTEDMSGIYTCKAYNNITSQNKTAHKMLTVVDPITDVRVETPMYPPKEDYPYMLTCNVTGPADHVYWKKNDSGHGFLGNNKTLSFNPLHRNDTGYYKCIAMNAVGNMSSPLHELLVNFGPEPAVISGPRFAETGEVATFKCSAMSVPSSQFSWWFNGTEVANTSVFTTEPLSFNMSGEYTCMAYNRVTRENSSVSIMVTVIEAIESVMINASTVPIYLETFTLTCEVTGPYDAIYWMKNNTVLNMNATHYHMENNMLHFTPVTTDNDGTYQCVATNKAAKHISPKYTLLVNYGPLSMEISGPFVGLDLIVSLICSADCQPDCDFTWYLNSNSTAVIQTGYVITFPVAPAHFGNYICVARNPVTKITMYKSKSFTVTGRAPGVHFSSGGGLLMMGLFAVFVPVLFT
nr:PREDICTED: carcinoembryonic antigen-related cell adhesion molecule 5-like [Paralichthys olivaceus]